MDLIVTGDMLGLRSILYQVIHHPIYLNKAETERLVISTYFIYLIPVFKTWKGTGGHFDLQMIRHAMLKAN